MDPIQPPTQQPIQPLVQIPDFQPKPNYLKIILFSILGILLVTSTIYLSLQNQKLQKQVLNPPVSQTVETPTPTQKSVSSISIPPDGTVNWKTYVDINNNYQLLFPPNWTLDDTTTPEYPEIIPSDEGPNNEGRIIITTFLPSTKSLSQFMKDTNLSTGRKNSDVYTFIRQIKISGEDGILTKGGCCGFFGQHAFVQHKDRIYQITLKGPIDGRQIKFQSVFDQILSTFKFIDDKSVCVPTYQVEANSEELTAKQYYSMRCPEQLSEKDCLSIDLYNQKTDDFSIPDEIPDCIWKNPTI